MRLQLALDRVEDDAGGEQLGEKERLGFAGLPEHIKRNGATLILRELGGDDRVFVGPIGAEGDS